MNVTFKGLSCSQFGLIMLSNNRGIFPAVTRVTQAVPGVQGAVDFGIDTYQELSIKVTFSYNFRGDLKKLRLMARNVRGWLYDEGAYHDLIFDDEPDRKYKAKVVAAVDLSQAKATGSFGVEFLCNPPYQMLLNNAPVTAADEQARLLWDTATLDGNRYMQDLSADGAMKFTVGGTRMVWPKIYLIGNIPAGLTLICSSAGITSQWKYDAALEFDGIMIDCSAQTVTRMSDGENLFPNVDPSHDGFFELYPGQAEIDVSGAAGYYPNDLTLAVEFTPMDA